MASLKMSWLLARQIERWAPQRPFHVRFWDGLMLAASEGAPDGEAPTFRILAPSAIGHLLRAPGRLGLGRAWVEGSLDTDDIDQAFRVVDSWQPPPLGAAGAAKLAGAALVAAIPGGVPRAPGIELRLKGARHSRARDAAAVRYHYDVGNEFFSLFLDESMTYSCAIFSRGASTLEQAQHAKLDLIAQKLELREGQRLLDVGCGWGSFAIHAARHYGVSVLGITLSPSQAAFARRQVAAAGLADQIEIALADYREMQSGSFDAISSIGMSEHVGESQIDEYARCLWQALRPGGLLLNHAIAMIRAGGDPADDQFSMRYVFPDGEPLMLSRVELALERAGFVTEHVEGFASDYAETLRHWTKRLEQRLDEAEALAGAQRTRVWRLYLRGARQGFEDGYTAVYQVRARRPQ